MNAKLMTALFLSALGLSLTATTVDGVLSENDTVLTVTVESGEADLGTTYLPNLTANTVVSLVKNGEGTLVVPSSVDLSGYRGAITVAGGIYRFQTATGVGALTGDATGVLTVNATAALEAAPASDVTLDLRGKTIRFAGTGPDGAGALRAAPASTQNGGWIFGTNLVMTGNAMLSVTTKNEVSLGAGSAVWRLDMGGHDLEVRPYAEEVGRNDRNIRFLGEMKVANPGNIAFTQGDLTLRELTANATLAGSAVNTLTMTSGVNGSTKLTFSKSKLYAPWTLRWHTDRDIDVASTTTTATTNENVWAGPVYLGEKMSVKFGTYQHYQRMTLGGKVSGPANIQLTSAVDSGVYTDGRLSLLSGDNDFTGAVIANHASLYLETTGALPSAGAGLVGTNASLVLKDNTSFTLPGAMFDGDSAVVGGAGAWAKSVVKTGSGTLRYASLVGGTELETRSGTVTVEPVRSAAMAGWTVGCRFYETDIEAQSAYENEIVHADAVELAPAFAYDNAHNYWKTKYGLITATGYLWNNSDSDVTWSFVTAMGAKSKLKINGTLVCSDTFFASTETRKSCGYGDAVLHPGANRVTLWIYTSATYQGPSCLNAADAPLWEKSKFGFVYDAQGRNAAGNIAAGASGWSGKHAYSYYSSVGDAGDATLATWTRPDDGTSCVKPGTGETVVLQPIFTRWTLPKASLGAATIAAAGKLDLSKTTLNLAGGERLPRGVAYTVATAPKGFGGVPTLSTASAREGWRLETAANGQSLTVTRYARGFLLMVK